jgi:hypothetical protein
MNGLKIVPASFWPIAQSGECGSNDTHQEFINSQECCHYDSQENNNAARKAVVLVVE